jgi:4-aminobutyrate aminotransferase-like enzyme
MATQAGKSTLRLTPPLILTEDQAHEALGIIERTLKEME